VFATLTAYEDYGHLTRAADSGFDLHFTKPADPNELIEQLSDCLHSGRSSPLNYVDGPVVELTSAMTASKGEPLPEANEPHSARGG
jgi:hypothetical protein